MRILAIEDCRAPAREARRAVFFDRDGVLINNLAAHVRSVGDVRVEHGAFTAVRRLREAGYAPVVVSNQAVVGRGILSAAQVSAVHRHVVGLFAEAGAPIEASYLCPHERYLFSQDVERANTEGRRPGNWMASQSSLPSSRRPSTSSLGRADARKDQRETTSISLPRHRRIRFQRPEPGPIIRA